MRLTALTLTSFRSYTETTLTLDAPRVLFAGVNGAGKSTIREAVRWLLTGHCAVTDARGVGADLLAPAGSRFVQVAATGLPFETLTRTRNNGIHELRVADLTGEPTYQQQALFDRIGALPAAVEAVLDTEHFLRLHHADAKALVLALLNVQIPLGEETLTLDAIEARYQQAFDARKVAKKQLQTHLLPPKPTEEFPTLDDIQAQLAKLRDELAAVQTGAGALLGKREVLEARLRAATVRADVPDRAALRVALEAAQSVATVPAPVGAGHRARFVALTQKQTTLTAFNPKAGCVLDTDMECPLTKRSLNKRLREIAIEIEALPPTVREPVVETPSRDAEIHRLERALEAAAASAAYNARQEAEEAVLTAELASLGELDPAAADALQTLQARITKGEMVLGRATAHWRSVAAYEAAVAKRAALQAEVDRLEELVKVLGPNGVRLQALAAALGDFTARINAYLAAYGWEIAFEVDPWTVLVNHRPVQTYSESEQFRIGLGVQLALAALSGLSFAIVDRLDMLDVANRALATQMILQAPVEQVIILSTREPSQDLPKGPGLIAYRLGKQGGQTIVLASTGLEAA